MLGKYIHISVWSEIHDFLHLKPYDYYMIKTKFFQIHYLFFFQVIFACLFAMTMAAPQWWGGYAHGLPADTLPATVQGGLVRYPNGALVPAQTPSVAAAGAAHLAYKFGPYAWGR